MAGKLVALTMICGIVGLGTAVPASASFDACTYDAGTRAVTATVTERSEGRLSVGAGGEILADGASCGAATTSNTDTIGAAAAKLDYEESEGLTIDLSGPGGPFVHPGTGAEIHFDVDLGEYRYCEIGDGCYSVPQVVKVVGTPGPDLIRVGRDEGAVLANFDASADDDADLRALGGGIVPELDGRGGADALIGLGGNGAGIDATTVTFRGGSGDDRLVTGGDEDLIYPGAGHDTVNASPSRRDVVSYADAPAGVTAELGSGDVSDDGFGSSDQLDFDVRSLRGSEHADHLSASYSYTLTSVTIDAGAGDDLVTGSEGSDTLLGRRGRDRIESGGGSRGGDYIEGGPGADILLGSNEADELLGGAGDDTLEGLRGSGTSPGGGDGDYLAGGPGSDVLDGGRDADVYEFDAAEGREVDTIVEGPRQGRDTLVFDYYGRAFENLPPIQSFVNLSSRVRTFGKSGRRTLRTHVPGGAWDIENISDHGFGTDRFIGNGRANVFRLADAVGDQADCRGGRDTVFGPRKSRIEDCEIDKRWQP